VILILYLTLFLSKGDVGTTMYPLLKIGVGPRPVALGETFVALADDITASYWNPAGLAHCKELQFFASHHEWFLDIRDEYVSIGMPGLGGYFSLGGVYSSIKDVEIWDDNNMPLGTRNLWSGVFGVSYGRFMNERLALGFGLKTAYEDLYEEQLTDVAADLGAQVEFNEHIVIGGALRNLSYSLDIPTDMKIGACYCDLQNFNLVLDLTLPNDNILHVSTGVEYNFNEYLSLRGGWRSGPYDISNLGWTSGFTTGIGLHFSGLTLDYAFVPYGKLGLTHRIALSGGLHMIKGTNSLRINVMDGDTHEPLEASLSLSGAKQGTFQTSTVGMLDLKNIPLGWVFINTFSAGYPEKYDSVYVQETGKHEKNIFLYMVKPGVFRGIVFDAATKKPISAHVVYKGPAYGKIDNDPLAGSFVLNNLPPGTYIFDITGKDPLYIAQSCSISIERGKLTEREFYLVKKREKIVLRGVNFETGKADLMPESFSTLDEAGRILLENPDIHVELAGHTDPREIATTEYPSNWELSLARAEVVRQYIIDRFNIDPERLSARGYADTQPIAPNTTEQGMAQNRRTEFRILD
jgi:outer membrane protein OmpA-like peptidoglycan-associated protein